MELQNNQHFKTINKKVNTHRYRPLLVEIRYTKRMYKVTLFSLLVLFVPFVTHAQGIKEFVLNFVIFLINTVFPFLLGLAFLFFVFNVIRFFVLGATSEEGREKARKLLIFSVLAFVLLLSFWGIVVLLASSFGLAGCPAPTSDYVSRDFMGPPSPFCR